MKITKILSVILMLTLIVCSVCCLASCEDDSKKENDAPEGLYALKEAYDKGLLTHSELQELADDFNNGKRCDETLDEELVDTIKKAWVKYYTERNGGSGHVILEDEPIIFRYHGTYNKCVACTLEPGWLIYPAVYSPMPVTIDGVTFNFQRYRSALVIWKLA